MFFESLMSLKELTDNLSILLLLLLLLLLVVVTTMSILSKLEIANQ